MDEDLLETYLKHLIHSYYLQKFFPELVLYPVS